MKRELTSRERVALTLRHAEPDRIARMDAIWEHTLRRWRQEGFPADRGPHAVFGYDFTHLGPDISLRFPEETIEETETCRIYRDSKGAILRSFKDHESTPETLDFTVHSPETWEQYKPRMMWSNDRVSWHDAKAALAQARAAGQYVNYFAHIGYDWIQRMVGAENVLVGMMQHPDWIKDMFDTLMDLVLDGYEAYRDRGFEFDGCYVADDLGYRNGAFFSPAKFRELELPAQKRLCARMAEDGIPVTLHSCGNVTELVPLLIEAGFACLQPLEVKSGMDMLALKRAFGDRLCFMGGIDARAMSDPDPAVIEQEIATKIPVMKQGGGYIYHSDHSVPSDVSLAQYQRVMALVEEYGRY